MIGGSVFALIALAKSFKKSCSANRCMYVSRTNVDRLVISVALHRTESCIKAIGALNLVALKCNKLASNEWIKFGAVAFLIDSKT